MRAIGQRPSALDAGVGCLFIASLPRSCILTIARATSQAELSWLRRTLDTLRAANDG
ncbi:hypothetical protein SANTM175S_02290 [Streptomyces antimycoticus]